MKKILIVIAVLAISSTTGSACVHCINKAFKAIALSFTLPSSVTNKDIVLKKSAASTKSNDLLNATLWLNPKQWGVSPDTLISSAVLNLKHVDGNAFGAVLFEPQYMPLETFADSFVKGFNSGSTTSSEKKHEIVDVTVNGKKMKLVTMTTSERGLKYTYKILVQGTSKGITAVMAFTHTDLYEELEPSVMELLAGLVPK